MSIVLGCVYTPNWEQIADVTCENSKEYCKKHGYSLIKTIKSDYQGFEKIEKAHDHLFTEGYDVVLFMDCDSIITNHNIKVEDFLDDEHDFYCTEDVNGTNTGVFIVKATEWSFNFLHKLLTYRNIDGITCEQNAIDWWVETKGDERIKFLPHPSINSYKYELYPEHQGVTHEEGQWEKGDFILHIPAQSLEKRLQVMKETEIVK